jgi:hypothetical protein
VKKDDKHPAKSKDTKQSKNKDDNDEGHDAEDGEFDDAEDMDEDEDEDEDQKTTERKATKGKKLFKSDGFDEALLRIQAQNDPEAFAKMMKDRNRTIGKRAPRDFMLSLTVCYCFSFLSAAVQVELFPLVDRTTVVNWNGTNWMMILSQYLQERKHSPNV